VVWLRPTSAQAKRHADRAWCGCTTAALARLAPLIGEERLPGGVSPHGTAGINGGAARDEGVGLWSQ
jgi:hypothetical protein